MAAYPRTSMGRPFQEKFADVFWEEDVDGNVLQKWKDGKTGYPIVDAAMRQCKTQGPCFLPTVQQSPSAQRRFHAQSRKNDSGHVSDKGE